MKYITYALKLFFFLIKIEENPARNHHSWITDDTTAWLYTTRQTILFHPALSSAVFQEFLDD